MFAKIFRAGLLIALAIGLSACGRAGSPLTPHQSAVKQAKADGTPPPPAPDKDKRFVLDGLLE